MKLRFSTKKLKADQHLLPPRRLEGKEEILQYVKKVGCIQYDPLDIFGRNAELTLQSIICNCAVSLKFK